MAENGVLGLEEMDTSTSLTEEQKKAAEIEAKRLADEEAAKKKTVEDTDNDSVKILNQLAVKWGGEGAKFDESGNLVDKEGKVVKTVEQVEADYGGIQDMDEYLGLVSEYDRTAQEFGLPTVDDKGAKIKYNAKSLAETYANAKVTSQLTGFLSSVPGLPQVYQHLSKGGKIEDFKPREDWSKVEIVKDDTKKHKEVILASLIAKNVDPATAEEIAEIKSKTGDSFAIATAAKNDLIAIEAEQNKKAETAYKEWQDKQIEEHTKLVNAAKNKVTTPLKTKMGEIVIPETDRNSFVDYSTKPVTPYGHTALMLDYENLDDDTKMAIDYLIYKKLDLNVLIKKAAATTKVGTFKKLMETAQELSRNGVRTGADSGEIIGL